MGGPAMDVFHLSSPRIVQVTNTTGKEPRICIDKDLLRRIKLVLGLIMIDGREIEDLVLLIRLFGYCFEFFDDFALRLVWYVIFIIRMNRLHL